MTGHAASDSATRSARLAKTPGFTPRRRADAGLGIGANVAMVLGGGPDAGSGPRPAAGSSRPPRLPRVDASREQVVDVACSSALCRPHERGDLILAHRVVQEEVTSPSGFGAEARENARRHREREFLRFLFGAPPALGRYFSRRRDAPSQRVGGRRARVRILANALIGGRQEVLGSRSRSSHGLHDHRRRLRDSSACRWQRPGGVIPQYCLWKPCRAHGPYLVGT